jgi:hypothetical protein
MQSKGGNYVRNTMASREITPDPNDLWPHRIVKRTDDPLINVYDLEQWDEKYWRRFSRMLQETASRGIIGQALVQVCPQLVQTSRSQMLA